MWVWWKNSKIKSFVKLNFRVMKSRSKISLVRLKSISPIEWLEVEPLVMDVFRKKSCLPIILNFMPLFYCVNKWSRMKPFIFLDLKSTLKTMATGTRLSLEVFNMIQQNLSTSSQLMQSISKDYKWINSIKNVSTDKYLKLMQDLRLNKAIISQQATGDVGPSMETFR